MWFGVISLFPEMFRALTDYGVSGRAVKQEKVSVTCWNPRDFTHDNYQTVDDRPYGGGPGGREGDLSVTSGTQTGSARGA